MTLVGKPTDVPESELLQATEFITQDALDTVVAFCQKPRASSAPL
jgi:hypothetical protein